MKVDLPHSPLTRVVFTGNGWTHATIVDSSHRHVSVNLPEGVTEDEVTVTVQPLDAREQPDGEPVFIKTAAAKTKRK